MEIPRLYDLCIGKITSHIWLTQVPPQLLVIYVVDTTSDDDNPFRPMMFLQFLKKVENITDQIMKIMSIPRNLQTKISVCIINLVDEMIDWCTKFKKLISSGNIKDQWMHAIHKTVFTPLGKLDKPRTVIRLLLDAHKKTYFDNEYAKTCLIMTPDILDSYLQNNPCIKSMSLINNTKAEVMKMTATTDPRFQHKLKKIANNLPPTVTVDELNICYNTIDDKKKAAWLCQIVWSLLEYAKVGFYSDKIIFTYHHLEDVTWQKLLKKHHLTIISKLFLSGPGEYCLLFYKQMISMMPETSIDILKRLFEEISSCFYTSGYNKVFKDNQKDILFRIWDNTPDSSKIDFISNGPVFVDKIGYMFSHLHDYTLCSMFIKDRVHSAEDRAVLINYLILYDSVLNKNEDKKSHVKELYKDLNIQGLHFDDNSLKALLLRCAQWISIGTISDHIFGDTIDMTAFKETLRKDNKFLIDVISNFHSMEDMDILITSHHFLMWCFQSTALAVSFVMEHVVNTDAMIKIYCDYLPRRSDAKVFVLDHIFNDVSVAPELRSRITNPNFFPKTLETLMSKGDPVDVFVYLKNMCDTEEKEHIIGSYLLSEVGVKQVLEKHVHSEGADLVCSSDYNIKKTFKNILHFKECWLYSDNLKNQFGDYMTRNSKAIYVKYFKVPRTSDLLPNESVRAHKKIINTHYKILMSLVIGQFSLGFIDGIRYSPFRGNLQQIAQQLSSDLTIADLI